MDRLCCIAGESGQTGWYRWRVCGQTGWYNWGVCGQTGWLTDWVVYVDRVDRLGGIRGECVDRLGSKSGESV